MSRFIHQWTARVVLGLALAVGLVPVAAAQPAQQAGDPAAVVDAYIAAFGHPEVQITMVTDDVTLQIVPPPPGTPGVWSGKAQAAGQFAFAKSQNPHVELVGSWQVSGDRVSGTVMVTTTPDERSTIGRSSMSTRPPRSSTRSRMPRIP